MASTRPFLMTGAALASAAAIVAAEHRHSCRLTTSRWGCPLRLKLSTAQVELTAITTSPSRASTTPTISAGAGYITTTNTYYPGVKDIYVAGASGVLYYLTDNILDSLSPVSTSTTTTSRSARLNPLRGRG